MTLSMWLVYYPHHFKGVILAKKVIQIVSRILCQNHTVLLLSKYRTSVPSLVSSGAYVMEDPATFCA